MADQQNQIQNYKDLLNVEDYTPGSAVVAGTPKEVGNRAGFTNVDLAANELGALQTAGLVKVVQKAETWAKGDDIWWDDDGDPVGGTAGSGAATKTPVTDAEDFWLGSSRVVTAATDVQGVVDLNRLSKGADITDPTDLAEALTAIIAIIDRMQEAGIIDNK